MAEADVWLLTSTALSSRLDWEAFLVAIVVVSRSLCLVEVLGDLSSGQLAHEPDRRTSYHRLWYHGHAWREPQFGR